ncbi:hypothetical protein GE21DRAFT_7115 [Neurospora crassa]|uniref:CCZ1/INTU/HSP4 first Longin domain-containing protein n=1 Tax=Neurospora crassa (strain ATCC 24698 / 74-OR23-1A / CBS 708.71 / DSM 1257 / FGSC 987) TaxID=367110 RepID=Q1K6C1_NEUCR|nr:hypothetical protein NCU04598 [Neurospora crassa OR74A]EAA29605.2 hypothetical protein NCU04598 [Neurospora crassa OR74A]KHE81360.1 hypothetical protein GE21DRAFT_7115 [Neurospora crassa]|eukprot:XP_958841.2 hypothetical protein NCU04598 [Neurospora crassa OR74A]
MASAVPTGSFGAGAGGKPNNSNNNNNNNIVPAQLGFLAIYNPSLGTTDDTLEDQIVYYASVTTLKDQQRRRHRSDRSSRRRHHAPTNSVSASSGAAAAPGTEAVSKEEKNERLRQIGLAQGMVEFGKSFSGGKAVNTIDTEKSRVVLHELEPGWWILASIDLTRLPLPNQGGTNNNSKTSASPPSSPRKGASASSVAEEDQKAEYSSRELKPAALLLRDLLRAHACFLLHHDSSLSSLFVRAQRPKFVSLLSRYWDLFLSTWNVLLHGNPACNIYGGIKITASGELGVGVGEEERGSGEREVLEGMVDRVEGLVDLVVGRFGEPGEEAKEPTEWLGTGAEPGADDGAIFLGTGALSRQSLRSVVWWMEDMYTWGEHAYGVIESPTATRVTPRRQQRQTGSRTKIAPLGEVMSPGLKVSDLRLPPPKPKPTTTPQSETEQGKTTSDSDGRPSGPPRPVTSLHPPAKSRSPASPAGTGTGTPASSATDEQGGVGHLFSYLKMGYGTHWSLGMGGSSQSIEKQQDKVENQKPKKPPKDCQFLIGLMGDLEGTPATSPDGEPIDPFEAEDSNSRLLLRTLTVEIESEGENRRPSQVQKDFGSHDTELAESEPQGTTTGTVTVTDEDGLRRVTAVTTANSPNLTTKTGSAASRSVNHPGSGPGHTSSMSSRGQAGTTGVTSAATTFDSQDRNKTKKLRVVVYVMRPFIFVFLFQLRTDSLAWEGFYRSLHQQMAPLRKSLLRATAYRPERPSDSVAGGSGQIYDLVWDPKELTVHSTIPNIPEPPVPVAAGVVGGSETAPAKAAKAPWSRIEALNTHNQILNMFINTRDDNLTGYERTCKTSRGWWIVWNRILERTTAPESQPYQHLLSVSSTRTASPAASTSPVVASFAGTNQDLFANVNKPRRARAASDKTLRERRTSGSSSSSSSSSPNAEASSSTDPSNSTDPSDTAASASDDSLSSIPADQSQLPGDDADNEQEEEEEEDYEEEHTSSETAIPRSAAASGVGSDSCSSSSSAARRRRGNDMVEVSKEIFLIRKATAGESGTGLPIAERHHGHTRGVSSVGSIVNAASAVVGGGGGGTAGNEKGESSVAAGTGQAAAAAAAAGGGGGGGWADGATKLAQGIGVDTRRYIEGLLTLNR